MFLMFCSYMLATISEHHTFRCLSSQHSKAGLYSTSKVRRPMTWVYNMLTRSDVWLRVCESFCEWLKRYSHIFTLFSFPTVLLWNCRQWTLYDRALPLGALLFTLSYWAIGLTVAKLWPQYKHHCWYYHVSQNGNNRDNSIIFDNLLFTLDYCGQTVATL